MEMEDQYGLGDLRQLMNGAGRTHFPSLQTPPTDLFSATPHHHRPQLLAPSHHHHHQQQHQHHQHQHPYEIMMMSRLQSAHHMMPRGIPEFLSVADSAGGACTNNTVGATSSLSGGGMDVEGSGGGGYLGGDGSSGRWPRQETLTLLEIRSRLDQKFKEANQKGPLWDEVSRIMCEEHGYQRSGKKCREKFENLYKYYKKTKEGKAGRQDGKHYRFFRQLEALYGDSTNTNNNNIAVSSLPPVDQSRFVGTNNINTSSTFRYQPGHQDTTTTYPSTQSSSDFEGSTSSEENLDVSAAAAMDDVEVLEMKRARRRRGWKAKIKEFIDAQMRRMMEKQEEWLERLMGTLEQKERERLMREEQWRKQEASRVEWEQRFWAKERAWIEARDKALMEALHKLTGASTSTTSLHDIKTCSSTPEVDHEEETWPECEIDRLVQLRGSMESRFSESTNPGVTSSSSVEEILWEEIASKMSCLGYERSGMNCKEKWESINNLRNNNNNELLFCKKRKENNPCYFGNNESSSSLYSSQGGGVYGATTTTTTTTTSCGEINNHEQGNNDGCSPPCNNPNAAAVVNEPCFPFLMGEGDNLWENYGLKLSKG